MSCFPICASSRRSGNLAGILITHAHEDQSAPSQNVADAARAGLRDEIRGPAAQGQAAGARAPFRSADYRDGARLPLQYRAIRRRSHHGIPSIPESNSIFLRTPGGNVLHTADWKFDDTPALRPPDRRGQVCPLRGRGRARTGLRQHQRAARRHKPYRAGGRREPETPASAGRRAVSPLRLSPRTWSG